MGYVKWAGIQYGPGIQSNIRFELAQDYNLTHDFNLAHDFNRGEMNSAASNNRFNGLPYFIQNFAK